MQEVGLITAPETYKLRLEVLWPHLNSVDECGIEVDGCDGTFHVGAKKDGEVVAIGTFLIEHNKKFNNKNQYRLRAMASSPEVRGENFGKKVIDFAINKLKSEDVEILWCDARKVALGFYEKMGFEVIGDFYEVRNVGPHKLMYYRIN